MTSPQVYYTEDVEQFANYDFLMVFDAAACPENQTVLCFKVGKDMASRSLLMRCFTSRCWRVAEDMGLSTFPWAEYFRRYEDYASKWGIAPVTGSDAWLYKSAPPIHWAFGLLWSGPDPVGLVLAEVRNRSPFYPLKAEWWTKCNRNRTGVIIRDSVRHNKLYSVFSVLPMKLLKYVEIVCAE